MSAQFLHYHSKLEKALSLNFLLFPPPNLNAGERAPLVVFLHGAGQRGDRLDDVLDEALPQILPHQERLGFWLLAPQCPAESWWINELDALSGLLEEFVESYPVQRKQVYLTGISMGAGCGYHWAAQAPQTFAGLLMCCGRAPWWAGFPEKARAFAETPLWIFHGAQDDIVPLRASQELAGALQAAGHAPRFDIDPALGHDCWTHHLSRGEVWDWLLDQRL